MVEQNHSAMARELLTIVASQGKSDTLQLLARLRLTEISGSALRGPFFKSLYTLTREQRIRLGTIADEVDFRAARTHLFRGNPVKALNLLEEMLAKRPQSPFFHERTILKALRWRAIHTTVREKRWLTAAKTYLRIPPMPRNDPHWVEIHMLGSRALIEVGLPQRAILVSLHLLRQGGDEIDETQILIDLAMAYSEAGDHYRSELTLSYLTENYPGLRKNRDVLRLKGMLSLKKGDLQNATRIATLLTKNPSKINSQDARLTIASALKSMKSEGLHAARGLINAALTAGHELTMEVADDLAMAASDCQHLEKSANPVELASGVQLLWAASCLSRVGRLDDALVYLQAAHAYRAADLSDEQLWPLIQMVGESIQWWSTYKERVSPEDDEDTNLEKPLDGSGVLNGSEASS
jgi:tetratricopeptide (TPR) repeat protein